MTSDGFTDFLAKGAEEKAFKVLRQILTKEGQEYIDQLMIRAETSHAELIELIHVYITEKEAQGAPVTAYELAKIAIMLLVAAIGSVQFDHLKRATDN